jgi:hypothetical protein
MMEAEQLVKGSLTFRRYVAGGFPAEATRDQAKVLRPRCGRGTRARSATASRATGWIQWPQRARRVGLRDGAGLLPPSVRAPRPAHGRSAWVAAHVAAFAFFQRCLRRLDPELVCRDFRGVGWLECDAAVLKQDRMGRGGSTSLGWRSLERPRTRESLVKLEARAIANSPLVRTLLVRER